MTRARTWVVGAVVFVAVTSAVTGCDNAAPTNPGHEQVPPGGGFIPFAGGAPGGGTQPTGRGTATSVEPTTVGALVVPGSSHVTGTYSTSCHRGPGDDPRLPVMSCTPGAVRDDIDPDHLEWTVCKPGWSDSVRPPTVETNRMKTAAMRAYGVPEELRPVTELDHKVPESLGGASHALNVWPQVSDKPGKGFHNTKDEVESRVHSWVCQHRGRWADTVRAFATNWVTVERVLGIRP